MAMALRSVNRVSKDICQVMYEALPGRPGCGGGRRAASAAPIARGSPGQGVTEKTP